VRETLSAGTNNREHEIIVLQQLVMNELENHRIRLYSRQHDKLDSTNCLGKTAKISLYSQLLISCFRASTASYLVVVQS
jgi:hypothetical protein